MSDGHVMHRSNTGYLYRQHTIHCYGLPKGRKEWVARDWFPEERQVGPRGEFSAPRLRDLRAMIDKRMDDWEVSRRAKRRGE